MKLTFELNDWVVFKPEYFARRNIESPTEDEPFPNVFIVTERLCSDSLDPENEFEELYALDEAYTTLFFGDSSIGFTLDIAPEELCLVTKEERIILEAQMKKARHETSIRWAKEDADEESSG